MNNDFERAVHRTLELYPYFGSMLQNVHTAFSKAIPTAGVMFDKKLKRFRLIVNPETFSGWKPEERVAVLVHELQHLVHQHCTIYKQLTDKKRANIAMDLVINQKIENLPEGCMDYRNFKDKHGKPFKPNLSTFEYYKLLSEATYKNPNGKGETTQLPSSFDEHGFEEGDEGEIEDALGDLFVRSKASMPGYSEVPGYVQDLIDQFYSNRAEINYKEMLNKAFRKSLPQRDRTQTWKRPNKRWGFAAPGTKIKNVPKIHIFGDTSGSITYEILNLFLNVIESFANEANSEINLHLFHTELYHSQRFKKGCRIADGVLQSGGTDLNGVFKFIQKNKTDLCIVLTDGYYGDVGVKSVDSKVLFLITEGGDVNHPLKRLGETFKINSKYHKGE